MMRRGREGTTNDGKKKAGRDTDGAGYEVHEERVKARDFEDKQDAAWIAAVALRATRP